MKAGTDKIASLSWQGNEWQMHPARGIYWPEKDMLLVADSHFGKIRHFQKAGIPLPGERENPTYHRLEVMLDDFQPASLVFLGDLFHSRYNEAWEQFIDWREQYQQLDVHLVKGNHDILKLEEYKRLKMDVHENSWQLNEIILTHDPMAEAKSGLVQIGGHLHPGIHLRGKGKQRLRLPCFYFDPQKCILPALGHFTGLANLEINKGASVFVTTGKRVMEI